MDIPQAPDAFGAEPEPLEEDLDNKLGLEDSKEPANKKRRTSGPRVKKGKEEVFFEEVERLQGRYQELLLSMRDSSSPFPNGTVVQKIIRSVTSKLGEGRTAGLFDAVSELETLNNNLTAVKEALRVALLYVTPSGSTRKAHEDAFLTAFQNLPDGALQRFPDPLQGHFLHLKHAKDRQMKMIDTPNSPLQSGPKGERWF